MFRKRVKERVCERKRVQMCSGVHVCYTLYYIIKFILIICLDFELLKKEVPTLPFFSHFIDKYKENIMNYKISKIKNLVYPESYNFEHSHRWYSESPWISRTWQIGKLSRFIFTLRHLIESIKSELTFQQVLVVKTLK